MAIVLNAEKQVKVTREFKRLVADEAQKTLRIRYNEITELDGVVVATEEKEYSRNYETWKSHELGQTIWAMIESDLIKPDLA